MTSLSEVLAQREKIDEVLTAARRQQRYTACMGRSMGFMWYQLSETTRAAIAGLVDGSFGLDEQIIKWAAEFDKMWEEYLAIYPDQSDFVDQIYHFTDTKIKTLIAEARLST